MNTKTNLETNHMTSNPMTNLMTDLMTDLMTNLMQLNDDSVDDSDDSDADENYIITTKVCKRLAKEFGLQETIYDETVSCEIPIEYGLSNSDVIIPLYYNFHKPPFRILDIDFYEIIKDDIKNCRTLNKYQLEYIKEIRDDLKCELIELFNNCVSFINEIMTQ